MCLQIISLVNILMVVNITLINIGVQKHPQDDTISKYTLEDWGHG
jgi:hypothetical protein